MTGKIQDFTKRHISSLIGKRCLKPCEGFFLFFFLNFEQSTSKKFCFYLDEYKDYMSASPHGNLTTHFL